MDRLAWDLGAPDGDMKAIDVFIRAQIEQKPRQKSHGGHENQTAAFPVDPGNKTRQHASAPLSGAPEPLASSAFRRKFDKFVNFSFT